jgi:hypothetical protein
MYCIHFIKAKYLPELAHHGKNNDDYASIQRLQPKYFHFYSVWEEKIRQTKVRYSSKTFFFKSMGADCI